MNSTTTPPVPPARHRTNPIAGTLAPVRGYGTLKIYRIEASQYFQARAYLDGKLIKKSLKTNQHAKALAAAKDFYNSLLLKRSQNLPLTTNPTIEKIVAKVLTDDQDKIDRGDRKARLLVDEKAHFQNDVIPFFKNCALKDIDRDKIADYVRYLRTRNPKRTLSSSSLRTYLGYLKKVLNFARRSRLIDFIPEFPEIKRRDNPREWLDRADCDRLTATLLEEVKNQTKVRYQPITAELALLCDFLVGTFLRPGDIKNLRHKHITVDKMGSYPSLTIKTESSKTSNSPVVSIAEAVQTYEMLVKLHTKTNMAGSEDYLFWPALKNRAYAFATMRRQFNFILNKANLKHSPTGAPRTLYSLRHTAIMRSVTESELDHLTLAMNARTSVDMIRRFYANHGSAKRNLIQLNSKKPDANQPSTRPRRNLNRNRPYRGSLRQPE